MPILLCIWRQTFVSIGSTVQDQVFIKSIETSNLPGARLNIMILSYQCRNFYDKWLDGLMDGLSLWWGIQKTVLIFGRGSDSVSLFHQTSHSILGSHSWKHAQNSAFMCSVFRSVESLWNKACYCIVPLCSRVPNTHFKLQCWLFGFLR